MYVTHVYAHSPYHLPKKVTEKPSVNHIGSSDEPPITVNFNAVKFQVNVLIIMHHRSNSIWDADQGAKQFLLLLPNISW